LGNRVGIGLGLITAGPKRLVAPALSADQLPAIDLLLVSHAHFDHLDRPTLAKLPRSIRIITSWGNRDLIEDLGFGVTELRWGESIDFRGVRVTARQVRHWGARTFFDTHRGFSAFLLEAPHHRVLYGGDTAIQDYFADIGKVDLAILGIGAYDPYIQAHATPEQAFAMADQVRADRIIPMHHSTFRLSHEPMGEPIERFLTAAGAGVDRVAIRQVGGTWTAE
jgi:L-ascorbate metabolism protein UlaG (beta-lactamase superfamily)